MVGAPLELPPELLDELLLELLLLDELPLELELAPPAMSICDVPACDARSLSPSQPLVMPVTSSAGSSQDAMRFSMA
jgi:hypothetical protein